jgi:hypothetical protein
MPAVLETVDHSSMDHSVDCVWCVCGGSCGMGCVRPHMVSMEWSVARLI